MLEYVPAWLGSVASDAEATAPRHSIADALPVRMETAVLKGVQERVVGAKVAAAWWVSIDAPRPNGTRLEM